MHEVDGLDAREVQVRHARGVHHHGLFVYVGEDPVINGSIVFFFPWARADGWTDVGVIIVPLELEEPITLMSSPPERTSSWKPLRSSSWFPKKRLAVRRIT